MSAAIPWFDAPGRAVVHGVPEGFDALQLGQAARALGPRGRVVVHVARDDQRLAQLVEALRVFAGDVALLTLPGWDCLPYDRVSPGGDLVSHRLETLSRLANRGTTATPTPLILVTTVAAITQRLVAREVLAASSFSASIGQRLDLQVLIGYFARNGYGRSDTVREPGEFALRGGIVDVFPTGSTEPLRLDFFGDVLETLRSFDPMTQRSTGTVDQVVFKPVSEILLDEAAINRFRSAYRALFGAETGGDALYAAVSAGRKHIGMEHWLPLFHDRLETVFDYLPDAIVSFDSQGEEAVAARFDQIAEAYETRRVLMASSRAEGNPYNPLPADRLYLSPADWARYLARRQVALFTASPGPGAIAGHLDAGGRLGRDFGDVRANAEINLYHAAVEHLVSLQATGTRPILAANSDGSLDRLLHLLRDHGAVGLEPVASWDAALALPTDRLPMIAAALDRGFVAGRIAIVTEADILGDRLIRATRRKRAKDFISDLSSIAEGDLVVHMDHGIGRYDGLVTLDIGGAPHDCLRVIYAGGDKLFVPVENIEVLSRFGSEESGVQLDKLGGVVWQQRRARIKQRIRDIADRLIRIAAEREIRQGEAIAPPEGAYDEFAARFPYAETDDQLRAIEDTLEDLNSGKPMDRLICGDVGFGKTEVAMRAAFVVAMSGLQVAVAVPTTLLARQHFRNFSERFKGLPVTVRQLSRLVTAKEATQTKKDLTEGTVDIVVGTHALLAKSIAFKRLGLLIVDEEQHFGVGQKERLKELRANIHVLTLTATPIPRTLQMALSGVRDMSIIATPPIDRLAIRTFVLPYDPAIVREAILREQFRGGQTFYVCPRLEDLDQLAERIRKLVPEVKLAIAHGRLAPSQLEDVMTAFCDGQFDVLLSTNIVESGLDIPTANTMIIHRADMFGLAQLYQLRGRIGRSKTRAYAYLTLPPDRVLSVASEKRLDVMQTLDQLGAGFQLASHDLDIRGAGNLLGEEQSGHIREVGIELYQQMLEEAVAAVREGGLGELADQHWTPQITLGTSVLIPEEYVPDLAVRLSLYRRVSTLEDRAEIDAFAAEMIDRFGPMPSELDNLLRIIQIKRLCRIAGIDRLDAGPKGVVVSFRNNSFGNPGGLVDMICRRPVDIKLRPDHKLVFSQSWDSPLLRIEGVQRLVDELAKIAA